MPPVACCALVPANILGLIVGRAGTKLRQIVDESGCEVDITSEQDTPSSLSDRIIIIRGEAHQKEIACRNIIRIVHSTQDVGDDESGGVFVVLVPTASVGFIEGPRGATVSTIVQTSGANVEISGTAISGTEYNPICLKGSVEAILGALGEIDGLLQHLADNGRLGDNLWLASAAGGLSLATPSSIAQPLHNGTDSVLTPRGALRNNQHVLPCGNLASGAAPPSLGGAKTATATPNSRTRSNSRGLQPLSNIGSRSRNATLGGGRMSEFAIQFVVDASVAAWIIGRDGRQVADLRERSGASVEVARDGGSMRLVEIRGSNTARMFAIQLLLEAVEAFPSGASRNARIYVPAYAIDQTRDALKEIQHISGGADAELVSLGASGEGLLCLSGPLHAVTRAAQEAASILEEAMSIAAFMSGSTRSRSRSGSRPPSAGANSRAPELRGCNEAALLHTLVAGPTPSHAQLRLVLPVELVSTLDARGLLRAIASQSGSRLEINAAPSCPAAGLQKQLLTITGTMMGNAMAVYYLMELSLQKF